MSIISSNAVVLGASKHVCTGKIMLSVGLQPTAMIAMLAGGQVLDFNLQELGLEGEIERVVLFCAKDGDELAKIIKDNSAEDTKVMFVDEEGGLERVPDDLGGLD